MASRFEVHVAGLLPETLNSAIRTRFGQVALRGHPNSTIIHGTIADQAAFRALLTLIWDTGSTVLSASCAETPTPERPDQNSPGKQPCDQDRSGHQLANRRRPD